jgi:D-alanyl-D-alanine carboxypeptidase (penicillin-binding protein 5/6)
VVVEAGTGRVLFEDRADREGYPASMVKLMVLLLIQEKVEQGRVGLDERVRIGRGAAGMGGSQVYLAEGETFSVEDLLYALMIQSANDAAVALALHLDGSKEAFVARMNARAAELGMTRTMFHSVHGLPPGAGQKPDVSTAYDMALLSRAVLRHPDLLRYTSAKVRGFRSDTFIMRTHNKLLSSFEGCDGLKTGYFRAAGYSVAATARRSDRRLVAVVLGSKSKATRDAKAAELMAQGFLAEPDGE